MQDPSTSSASWIVEVIQSGGGWGAFLLALIWGGRAFMSLARDFSTKVVSELEKIREAIVGQEKRVDVLNERVQVMSNKVDDHGTKIDRLALRVEKERQQV